MLHDLKIDPSQFEAIRLGDKKHEVRNICRGFVRYDILHLHEYSRDTNEYTGRECKAIVTHITYPNEYGLPGDICVMTIVPTIFRGL